MTYVIVDDSSDEDVEELVNNFRTQVDARVVYRRSEQRLGIAKAKNACLASLQGHDHVFLLDDDCWPRKPGWASHWAESCQAFGVHHSTYQTDLNDGTSNGAVFSLLSSMSKGGVTMDEWSNCMGVALYFSDHALEVLGGYDADRSPNCYGYEHANISQRAERCGLTDGKKYVCPADLRDWIYAVDIDFTWFGVDSDWDMPPHEALSTSVTPQEAAGHKFNAGLLSFTDTYVPLVDPIVTPTMVDVVIATKCNDESLFVLLNTLHRDPMVNNIVVIADGDATYNRLIDSLPVPVFLDKVPLASGLHRMWNMGMDYVDSYNNHVAIINDDVTLSVNSASIIANLLDSDSSLGLISPSDSLAFTDRLNVTTGFAGFCMFLAADLAREWRFDERMMWWYGDNDVISWVAKTKLRVTGLTGLTHALGNKSHTINTAPPPNFHKDIANDALIYKSKWPEQEQ